LEYMLADNHDDIRLRESPLGLLEDGTIAEFKPVDEVAEEMELPVWKKYPKSTAGIAAGIGGGVGYWLSKRSRSSDDEKNEQTFNTAGGPVIIVSQDSGEDGDGSIDIRPRDSDLPR